jgi:hypothetical protein
LQRERDDSNSIYMTLPVEERRCVLFSMGAQFVVFLRWIHRRMRDDEIQHVFIRDLALKHLPSIYRALHTMAEQQGIRLDETPMVNYVDMRNGGRHR